jgi:hypothetical protein
MCYENTVPINEEKNLQNKSVNFDMTQLVISESPIKRKVKNLKKKFKVYNLLNK